MKRSRRFFIFIVATCILCLVRSTICDESQNDKKTTDNQEKKIPKESVAETSDNASEHKKNNKALLPQTGNHITSKSLPPIVHNKSITENIPLPPEQPIRDGHPTMMDSGALLRGFYVLAGLSAIAFAYMVFRSFGLNKQRPQMVRKYGVLAHKQDIEMRPLPLDEDDEDDTTVFDVSGLASSRQQSRNSM